MTYQDAISVGRQIGLARATHETPAEFVARVEEAFKKLRASKKIPKMGLLLQVGFFAFSLLTGTPTPPPPEV